MAEINSVITLKFCCKADLEKFQKYFKILECQPDSNTLTVKCPHDKAVIEIATKIFHAEVLE